MTYTFRARPRRAVAWLRATLVAAWRFAQWCGLAILAGLMVGLLTDSIDIDVTDAPREPANKPQAPTQSNTPQHRPTGGQWS